MKSTIYLKSYTDTSLGQVIDLLIENGYTVSVSKKNTVKTRIDISKNEEEQAVKGTIESILDQMEQLKYMEELSNDLNEDSVDTLPVIDKCIDIVHECSDE